MSSRSLPSSSRAVVVLVVFVLLVVSVAQAVAQELMSAPLSPAFVDYLKTAGGPQALTLNAEGFPLGAIPAPLDLSHTSGKSIAFDDFAVPASLPASYDMRTLSPSRLTSVKNQGSCGSCWAFAAYGSLESCLLPSESLDLSENNMKNTHGFDWTCCYGGNHFVAAAYLARWSGPLSESSDPYNTDCTSPGGGAATKHVQRVLFLPDRSGPLANDSIKQAVMTYGPVYTTFYWGSSSYNSSTKAYYYNGSDSLNHAVGIVGWDDNYSRSNFSTAPPGDGAFIIRNSWGAGWGQSGYFYISYYDSLIGKDNTVFHNAEPTMNYNQVYQYDPLGWVSSLGYGSTTAWFANVFNAASSGQLAAASFYTASPGSSYEISVYLDPTIGPVGGSPVATKSGIISGYGYETIGLNSPVQLTAGHKFSVVVKLTTPNYNYPVPYEYPLAGYSSAAASNAGESYISHDGYAWSDINSFRANSNVCLKAFTWENAGVTVMPSNDFGADGPVGGPFGPSKHIYTLTNNGSGSINWTVSKEKPWVSISSTGGTLGPHASADVTVSLNAAASALPAGSYSDALTFTNTTDGAGSTTRDVSLLIYNGYLMQQFSSYFWYPPTYHTDITLDDDGISPAQALPFPFTFYGKTYDHIYVAANGMIGFSENGLDEYSNTNIPNSSNPNAVLYPYWDDLDPTAAGSVKIGEFGMAPNRRVVVSWVGVPQYSAENYPLTFQVILCEKSCDIVFSYKEVQTLELNYGCGRSATIGIENDRGAIASRFSFNGSTLVGNDTGIGFTSRTMTPSDAKQAADYSTLPFQRAIVTAVFGDAFYIESDDRSAGIRVVSPGHGAVAGMRVSMMGKMRTATWGERYVEALSIVQSGSGSVAPIGLSSRSIGGGGFWYTPGGEIGQKGMKDGVGIGSLGLLLRTAGRVTSVGSGCFHLDDGCGVVDSSGQRGIRVTPGTASMPSLGSFVQVTGIASCYNVGDDLYPVLLVANPSGIVVRQ